MDYNEECGRAIDQFEVQFRKFVQDEMCKHFGEQWWRRNVPNEIKLTCGKRQENEQSSRFPRLQAAAHPIHYTNLGELKDVICRNDNFNQVFKAFFGNSNGISARIEELVVFRNPAAHNRPIFGQSEYQEIIVACRSIFHAMEIELPSLFQSWSDVNPIVEDDEGEPETLVDEVFVPARSCTDNLPRPDYADFFGREEERKELLDHLRHPRAWITVIDGIGGVGKTALALNCAECVRDMSRSDQADFEYVIWASAKTEKLNPQGIAQLQPNFSDLPSLLNTILEVTGFEECEPQNRLALVKEILAIGKTLLVLDNLETVSDPDLYDFLQDISTPSKVLATTRTRLEGSHRNLRLTALPVQDALEMVRQLATDLDAAELSNESDETLRGLIQRLGGIPLAMKLAVGRIATGLPLSSYLDKLDSGDAQRDLLEFCFTESWNGLDNDCKLTLLAVTLFSEDPSEAELRRVIGIPEIRTDDAIGTLIQRAFLNRTYDRDRETNRYSLLPLTTDFVQEESAKDPDLRAQLQDNYSLYLLEKGRIEEALGQVAHLIPTSGSMPEEEKLSTMLVESAWRSYQGGNYGEALNRLESASSYKETAFLNHTWGVIERDENRFGTAREKFRRALDLDGSRLPTWRSMAKMEQRLENWDRAVQCFAKACEIPKSDAQDFHGLGVCLSRLATRSSRSIQQDLLLKAQEALRRGFYEHPVGYRETHHNVVNCHSLALVLDRLGQSEEALAQCGNGLQLEPHNERLIRLKGSIAPR